MRATYGDPLYRNEACLYQWTYSFSLNIRGHWHFGNVFSGRRPHFRWACLWGDLWLSESGSVSLEVFGMTGRPIKQLYNNWQIDQSTHTENLQTGAWPGGVYLVVLRTEYDMIKKQLVVLSN